MDMEFQGSFNMTVLVSAGVYKFDVWHSSVEMIFHVLGNTVVIRKSHCYF